MKYVDSTSVSFKFIDSLRSMNSSLDQLASSVKDLPIVEKCFAGIDMNKMKLLRRKGVYPYEYIDSREKLLETQLPAIDDFFSTLTGTRITQEKYKQAQEVWKVFGCRTLLDYTLLYMKLDICLLADVFEQFCDNGIKTYGLDPSHYYTAPGLSWDAMLKCTGIKLELLDDIDMVIFIEKGIRGG